MSDSVVNRSEAGTTVLAGADCCDGCDVRLPRGAPNSVDQSQ